MMKEKYEEVFEILENLKEIPEVDNADLYKIRHILLYQKEMMVVYTNAVVNLVSEKVKLIEDQNED